ncbi:DUF1540 domain-containing protein [Clostridium lacusfryxellense]|uniref:DUF1540 domain-containing protein n=1 Tax=Clostridium lacusfryxellense TaxID=205328 RepID=UPI001C0C9873|nr:DUF1540 domain-containing protein [Clostridium lacusfryxellense]MBU3111608.1 DUF1540 domain-containing protein [Clostridium lacusfryxellense]
MSKINCGVENCSHNNEHTCFANIINVGGKSARKESDTCCASFLDSLAYSSLTNIIDTNSHGCDVVSCTVVTCTYNSNELCSAKSIEVNGHNVNLYSETDCLTFNHK